MPVAIEVKNATAELDAVGYYAGGTYRLIPAPLVTITKNYETTESNIQIGASLSISLNGTILATVGNPVVTNYDGGKPEAHFQATGWAGTVDVNDDHQNSITDATHNDRLGMILAKQEAIRTLFAGNLIANGEEAYVGNVNQPYSRGPVKLILEPLNGGQAFEFLCTVTSINFEEGLWYDQCKYTVDMTCDNWSNNISEIVSGFNTEDQWRYKVKDIQESWDIQEAQDTFYFGFLTSAGTGGTTNDGYTQKVWDITHNVSAVGKRSFSEAGNNFTVVEAFQNASGIIYDPQYGLLASNKLTSLGGNEYGIPSGLNMGMLGSIVGNTNIGDGTLEDEYRIGLKSISETQNITGGSISVVESFIYAPRNTINVGATEVMSLSEEDNANSAITTYNLNGTVTGFNTLGIGHTASNSWVNASGYYAHYVEPFLLTRISRISNGTASGVFASEKNINPTPLSKSISKSPISNEISYNIVFDTRRQNLTSALFENLSVQEGLVGNIYAEIPIIGREAGPIIHYLDSNTSRTRTLNIGLTVPLTVPTGDSIQAKAQHLLVNSNPRLASPYASELTEIVAGVNPNNTTEAPNGAVFDPPTEDWNADTGEYSYSVTWKWESPSLI